MSKTDALARITRISRLRTEAAQRRLAAADQRLAKADRAVQEAEAAARAMVLKRDQLRLHAEAAFLDAPQSAHAVVRLIENNTTEDRRTADAWSTVETLKAEREDLRAAREEARKLHAQFMREADSRTTALNRLTRIETRRMETRQDACHSR